MNENVTYADVLIEGVLACRVEYAQRAFSRTGKDEIVRLTDDYYRYVGKYYVVTSAAGVRSQLFGLVGSAEECHVGIHAQASENVTPRTVALGGCPYTACAARSK